MAEQERQEIENLSSAGKCEEDNLPIGGKIQTLDQYLKRYWIWENRGIFASTPNYKCKENIVEILKSEEDISDSRFEKIVDSRDYEKGPAISDPLSSLENLKEMLAGKLNVVIGEVTLPSGNVVKGYDFLTCQSEECKEMLREKKIAEYDDKSCPLTVKNRSFFTWILNRGIPFRKEKSIKGFINRMKKNGISYTEDRVLHIMINDGLISLAYNPQLLFTGNMILKRLEEIFSYEKDNEGIVNDRLKSLSETVERLNFKYPHVSSNNIWIFENIAMRLEQCEREIIELGEELDRNVERETVEERVKAMKCNVKELKRNESQKRIESIKSKTKSS